MLEELNETQVQQPEVEVHSIDFSGVEQNGYQFFAANQNQNHPVLVDGDQSISESCTILQYPDKKCPRIQGMALDVTARILETPEWMAAVIENKQRNLGLIWPLNDRQYYSEQRQ